MDRRLRGKRGNTKKRVPQRRIYYWDCSSSSAPKTKKRTQKTAVVTPTRCRRSVGGRNCKFTKVQDERARSERDPRKIRKEGIFGLHSVGPGCR